MSTIESVAFKASLYKTNQILNKMGLQIDDEDNSQSVMKRLWNRKLYCFCIIIMYGEVFGEVAWLVLKGMNFFELTYAIPCNMLCILGSAKSYYKIKYGHHINDLIHSLQALQLKSGLRKDATVYKDIQKNIDKHEQAFKILLAVNIVAIIGFFGNPLITMAYIYHTTGEVKYRYPFLVLYPFDPDNPWIFPFVYLQQIIVGLIGVFTVFAPDCLYYMFCTYIKIQFLSLQYNLERIIIPDASLRQQKMNDSHHKKFEACVDDHKELIRCCGLIEITYSKSTLFNFMSSSILLCMAGFNILAHEDIVTFSNFLSFLFMCLMQIYLICDYGDKVTQASVDLSSAIYNSQWYMVDAKSAKDLLIILIRAQKPCKLTAFKFVQVNLPAFTRILSTSWSYFALLQSVYSRKQ